MDTVIQLLDTEDKFPSWKETRYKKLLDGLRIQSTEDFDMLYSIDLSYLFFFRTIPIQKEALDDGLSAYFERAEGKEDVLRMLHRCLANKPLPLHSDVLISLSFRLRSGACSMIPRQVDPEKMSRNACLLYPPH